MAAETDGWIKSPDGWNVFDASRFREDIIDVKLCNYDHEYIMVLAGGLDQDGQNHPWVKDRLDIALRLYRRQKRKIIILGGGTYHKPPYINEEGYAIHESTMGAKYLVDHGVDRDDIYREWGSYDTIANAYFSLINFVIPLQLKKVLVITSDFHMPRSRMIFYWIYKLWNQDLTVDYLEVSTKYLDPQIIGARSNREKNSLENLKVTKSRITTWRSFHDWFYREHDAYNCRFDNPKEHIDENTKNSY